MTERIDVDTTVCATSSQVSCDLSGEKVILQLESGTYFGLDGVGQRIWELVQTPRRVSEVTDTILTEFDVTREVCEPDILALLEELRKKALVSVSNG